MRVRNVESGQAGPSVGLDDRLVVEWIAEPLQPGRLAELDEGEDGDRNDREDTERRVTLHASVSSWRITPSTKASRSASARSLT